MRAHFNGFLELKKPFIILNTFKWLPQQQSKTYDYFYAYFFAIKAYLLHLKPYGGINCNLKSILFLSQDYLELFTTNKRSTTIQNRQIF